MSRAGVAFDGPSQGGSAAGAGAGDEGDEEMDRAAYKRGEIDLKTGLNRRTFVEAAEAKELQRKRRAIELARKGSSIKSQLMGKVPHAVDE